MNKKIIAMAVGACIIGFAVGRNTAPECILNSHEKAVKDNKQLVAQVDALQKKVQDAKPFFDMKQSEQYALKEKVAKEKEEHKAKLKEENSKTLSSGHFMSGKDFNAGTYNIEVVSGNGNVYSNNSKNSINAIMGTGDNDVFQKTFKNAELPFGTTLTVDGLTIKLTPVELTDSFNK